MFVRYRGEVTAVAQLVEELLHESEGRGFDSRWGLWNFSVPYPCGRLSL